MYITEETVAGVPGAPTYPDHDTFLRIHNEGVKREMEQELLRVQEFNEAGKALRAILLTRPSPDDETASYTVLINFESNGDLAPKIGERCQVRLVVPEENGTTLESPWALATRIRESNTLSATWDSYVEFAIPQGAPEWESAAWQDVLGNPMLAIGQQVVHVGPEGHRSFKVNLSLRPSLVTYEAERATLRKAEQIWNSHDSQRHVLDTLVLLKKPRKVVNLAKSLYHHLPLNQSWDELLDTNPPTKAESVLSNFNEDQKKAFKLMRMLPDGLAFIPGCPGSGKTQWALSNVALAQSGPKKAQTLYLLDINHTVDDAADRMVKLYEQWGIKRKVIRMFGWSKVTQQTKKFALDALEDGNDTAESSTTSAASTDGEASCDAQGDEDLLADFRKSFAREAVKARIMGRVRDHNKAPTLDEAAWDYYQEYADQFHDITDKLGNFLEPTEEGNRKKELSPEIVAPLCRLYKKVLRSADFIATTPVAAQMYLQFLEPDLVMFDEAGHAREVSTLMSVVYFRPKAWLFVGDYRQIRPFISRPANGEKDAPLLFCISAMERLALNKMAHSGLLKNHRAYADLHQLPSDLFYGGEMTSETRELPDAVHQLRMFLDKKRGRPSPTPRLVVDVVNGAPELKGKSSFNPKNQAWVMECVAELLREQLPRRIDGNGPGTILIVSPYKAAVEEYETLVEERYPGYGNVMVRTVNTSQGLEADFVIIDLVRGSKFIHDPRRLCVALTRARQGEVIMMNLSSMWRFGTLRKMWESARAAGQAMSATSVLRDTTDTDNTIATDEKDDNMVVW